MASANQLCVRLAALVGRFESSKDDPAGGSHLLAETRAFRASAGVVLDSDTRLPCSEAIDLVEALCSAGERLAALDSLAGGRFPHMTAACELVEACMSVAMDMQYAIPPESALRMLRCLTLLLGSSAAWLRQGAVAAGPGSGDRAAPLTCIVQALNIAVSDAYSCWPSCLDGLAAGTLAPQPLLSWLAAVVKAVHQLDGEHNGIGAQAALLLSTVMDLLCTTSAFEQHAARLQQDAALCRSLTRMLIQAFCAGTPALPGQRSEDAEPMWAAITEVAAALISTTLRSTAEQLAPAAAGGDRFACLLLFRQLEASAQLLHLATTAGSGDCLGPSHRRLAARQLGLAAWHSYLAVRLRQERIPGNPPPDGRLELQQAHYLLPAVRTMVRLLQAEHDEAASAASAAASEAGSRAGSKQTGAGRAAELANALEGVLHYLQLATLCKEPASGSSASASGSGETSGSETSLELWSEATCAALRALPMLAAALPHASSAEAAVISKLAEQVCSFVYDAIMLCLLLPAARQRPAPAAPAALGANQHSLWQLHTATTRACHWLATSGLQQLPSLRPRAASMISAAALPLTACAALLQSYAGGMGPAQLKRTRRALSAMAAAHFEALHALLSALQPSAMHDTDSSKHGHMAAVTLAGALDLGPACLQGDPRLLDMFRILVPAETHVLEHVWPGLRGPGASAPAEETGLLHIAQRHARTAALLLTTPGVLDGEAIDLLLRKDRLNAITLAEVLSFSMDETGSITSTAMPGDDLSLLQAVAAARTQLSDAMRAGLPHMLAGRGPVAEMPRVARGLKACLPAARQLATALQAWWARPSQQQADQLELATIAAARSCAYLRCANLGGEGGPAAGEGAGSKRCSACRAVWYCGTACAHANWRAGHKLVCETLGSQRPERKERRQQAAEAAEQ